MNRQTKILGLLGGTCLVLVLLGIYLAHWANSADTVTLAKPLTEPANSVASKPLAIKTAYFSTILPAGFNLKGQTETADSPTVQLRLVARTNSATDQQFAVTRGVLPPDGLSGVGDYNLRATDTAHYSPCSPPDLLQGAKAFCDTGQPATMTLFRTHNGHYIELAFSTSGGASLAQLQTTYAQVIHSWQWR